MQVPANQIEVNIHAAAKKVCDALLFVDAELAATKQYPDIHAQFLAMDIMAHSIRDRFDPSILQ